MKNRWFPIAVLVFGLSAALYAESDNRPFTEVPLGSRIMLRAAVFNGWEVFYLQRPMLPGSTHLDHVAGFSDPNALEDNGVNGPANYIVDVSYDAAPEGRRFKGYFSVIGKTQDHLILKLDKDYVDSFDEKPSGLNVGEQFQMGCTIQQDEGGRKLCSVDDFAESIQAGYGTIDF